MRHLRVLVVLLGAGCINFDDAYRACHDSGPCVGSAGGGTGGGAGGGGGSAGGGGMSGDWFARLWGSAAPGPQCTSGFCWEFPYPSGNGLNAVTGDESRAVIVGEVGTLLLYDGQSFRTVGVTENDLNTISRDEHDRVFVSGAGVIVTGVDGGWTADDMPCGQVFCNFSASWSRGGLSVALGMESDAVSFELSDTTGVLQLPLVTDGGRERTNAMGMDGVDRDHLYSVLWPKKVIQRVDAGAWRVHSVLAGAVGSFGAGVCAQGPDELAVADNDGNLYVHADGGWSAPRRITTAGLASFTCGPSTSPYLGVSLLFNERSALLNCDRQRCVDAGSVSAELLGAAGAGATRWGVGRGGVVVRSTPSGTVRLVEGGAGSFHGIAADDAGTLWAVGAGNRLMSTRDGGWAADNRGTGSAIFYGIAMSGPGTGYITTDNGPIKWLRPGTALSDLQVTLTTGQPSAQPLYAITAVGQQFVAVGGQGLIAMKIADGGFGAVRAPSAGQPDLNDVFTASDGVAIAVGDAQVLLIHPDGGINAIDAGTPNKWFAVWGQSSSDFWVVGDSQGWRHLVNGAVVESNSPAGGGPWVAVGGRSNTDLWAADDQGQLYRYDGAAWSPSPIRIGSHRVMRISALPQGLYVLGAQGMIMRQSGP